MFCAVRNVNYCLNLIYDAKLTTSVGQHDTQALPRRFGNPKFSGNSQVWCDVRNEKWVALRFVVTFASTSA